MKTVDEMANNVLERRDKYFTAKKRKRKTMMAVLPVLAVVLVFSAAIGINRGEKPPVRPTIAGQTEAETKSQKKRETVLSFPADCASCYATPEPGTYFFFIEVKAAMEHYKHSEDVDYVLTFDVFSEKGTVAGDELEQEYSRLTEKGYRLYRCRTWEYQGENAEKVYRDIVVGVFTEEELGSFAVNPEYGYAFYFAQNGDGSPLSFDESTATLWTYTN